MQATCTFTGNGYYNAKAKIQKATPIMETSENEAIFKSIIDGGGDKQL